MPCVSKPSSKHEIIMSLWLICYIQYGFSISYLSIPGEVARDRCNISHIFTSMSNVVLRLSFICFSGRFKTGQCCRKVGGQECGVIIICSKILAYLISVKVFGLLFSSFIMGYVIIIISIHIIIIIIIIMVMVMVFIFSIHNQYNYPII